MVKPLTNEQIASARCPICGSGPPFRHFGPSPDRNWRIVCRKCGSDSAAFPTLYDAILSWIPTITTPSAPSSGEPAAT